MKRRCDCGALSTSQPGHSHWCSLITPLGDYIAWKEFLELTKWNVAASYVYVTDDVNKLYGNNTFLHGYVIRPEKAKEMLNNNHIITELWIENECEAAEELFNLAVAKFGKDSIVRMLELREKI